MIALFNQGYLSEKYGLIERVVVSELNFTFSETKEPQPFTNDFPRADVHELLAPDILHQIIKGTFKDHLVLWVEHLLIKLHGKAHAQRVMDDIDHRRDNLPFFCLHLYSNRLRIVPAFGGLRYFPQGRGFKQWTGNDSKALMKACTFLFYSYYVLHCC